MSKESIKKTIIDLRASIAREREQKKKDNARIAASIKSARPICWSRGITAAWSWSTMCLRTLCRAMCGTAS